MSTRLKEMIRKGIVLHALKRFKVAYTTTGRMLKVATSLRRKTMNEKKLVSKDLSQSSTLMECRSLELDGIRKQRAFNPALLYFWTMGPRSTTVMPQARCLLNHLHNAQQLTTRPTMYLAARTKYKELSKEQ
jgi:hypothetical protein